MIRVDAIEKRYGPQILFQDLSWHIRPGERIGLVGANGAGKTTLVRILSGREEPDAGRVQKAKAARIGYLPQEVMEFDEGTILESALEGMGEIARLEREMHALAERLASHPPRQEAEDLTTRYGEIQDRFAAQGGYDLETRARTILTGLGFDPDNLDRPLQELSGGWQMRVALARLLLADPELLLLDEPTNHLDLESLNWLEEFLQSREGAFVVISHDRYFLNRMVGRIAELARGRLTLFTGNYDHYIQERERRFAAVEAAARNQAKEIEKMTRFIERFRAQATKARQVQSRIRMLEKMEKVEAPSRRQETVRFRFPQPPRSGQIVMNLEGLVKRYGDLTVYNGINFCLRREDRIALVGPNGAGKSTLLKVLAGVLPYEGGTRQPGHNATLVYYAQHALDALHPRNTVLAELSQAADTAMQPKIRGLLATFLFDADEWDKTVSVLSGGEKARLALAKMMLRPANLLLLDEPTNHLDLRSRDVLEEALAEYTGTICFISHDRYFINRIATTICEVDTGGLHLFPGNYDDYLARKASLAQGTDPGGGQPAITTHRAATPPRGPRAGAPAETAAAEPATGPRTRQQKRREAEARQRFSLASRDTKKKIGKFESRVAEEEKRLRLVEYEMSQPATYQNPQKAQGTARLQGEIKASIADLTSRWEEFSEKLEGAETQLTAELRDIAGD
ncbi:MAG: ABC-F family ATP-binding cassette domain-containing protein [Acidobacteria bacterium]|nr:ABC-F family ATP-binding cassette domain-containing protein [Acidobacteriota bacterium]